MQVGHNQLIPGRFYKVIFDKNKPSENVYTVRATSHDYVATITKNNMAYATTGTISYCDSCEEISEAKAKRPNAIFDTNKSAASLLSKEEK